jgi:ABC-type nitrate/sulfonate/bicarbonate transport system substrate-binding protein
MPRKNAKTMLVIIVLAGALRPHHVSSESVVYVGGSGSGLTSTLMKVAREANVWKKHGLDVRHVYFTSGALLGRAMLSGDIAATNGDIPGILSMGVAGVLDVKVIAVTVNRLDTFFVARKHIAKPEDLKGKRIGVSRFGSLSDISTRLLARFWKLDPDKELNILQTGNSPSRVAALIAGHVDAGLMSLTVLDKLLASGCCRILADLTELPLEYAQFGVAVPTALLKSQRETLRLLLESLIEGIYVSKTRPDVVLKSLKEEGIEDPRIGRTVYERLAKNLRDYPVPELKGIQTAIDSLAVPKARGAQAKDFMDTSLLEEIKKSGYIDRLYGKSP